MVSRGRVHVKAARREVHAPFKTLRPSSIVARLASILPATVGRSPLQRPAHRLVEYPGVPVLLAVIAESKFPIERGRMRLRVEVRLAKAPPPCFGHERGQDRRARAGSARLGKDRHPPDLHATVGERVEASCPDRAARLTVFAYQEVDGFGIVTIVFVDLELQRNALLVDEHPQ